MDSCKVYTLEVFAFGTINRRLENTLNYGLERVWALGYMKGSRRVVIGYDEGTVLIKLECIEIPVANGERLPLAVKELGSCDLYPQRDVVSSYIESGNSEDDQGVEEAFELLHEINGESHTGLWVTTMFHLDRPMYLLGYLASQSRVYLIDKEFNVMGYTLLLSLIEYKTLVMRGDLDRASEVLLTIPKNIIIVSLTSLSLVACKRMLWKATDLTINLIWPYSLTIAIEVQSESRWKQLGELAMSAGKLEMAEECLSQAMDLSGLLLLYSALGDAEGISKLSTLAREQGKNNVAFLCLFMLGKLEECLQLLVQSGDYLSAKEYLSYSEKRSINLVEAFKSMQVGLRGFTH
ncbi:hypothetical protein J5N97_002015 [Dioscorea zingiberensis]|uniref:COPA/B TPR domain-containing protein n=1 Tax=Dioscorea zingiberensis TaxID=325984 RepID=A0A9D5BVQ6_9LILI|nr:hypothetical protein J5N97_002015 [Dioscorea zingiberensis]